MIKKIIVLQGIPASGKSTWARQWVSEDPKHRVRFNRDDIRNMLGVYWVPSREGLINNIYNTFIHDAMIDQYDIVLDNMNLNKKTLDEIEKEVRDFNEFGKTVSMDFEYQIEYKSFLDTPLEVCIERDSKRESPIGEKTIRSIYARYKDQYNL